jgi:hypothetical protein
VQSVVIAIGRRRDSAAAHKRLAPLHAVVAQLVHAVDQHDRVLHHDTHQQDQTDEHDDRKRAPGNLERQHRAHHGERDGEHDHERMQQRLELRGHHQIHEEDRQGQGEDQRLHRALELLALAADADVESRAQGLLAQHAADLVHGRAQVAVSERGRDHGHALLVGAMDLARPLGGDHVGDRGQGDGPVARRVHDQVAHVLDRGAVALGGAHQHVDLAVAEAVARGHLAAHLAHDLVGDLAGGEPERSGAVGVEADLDLG